MLMYYTVHMAPNNFCITVSVMNVQYTQRQPFNVKSVHVSLKAGTILFEHLFVFLPTKKRWDTSGLWGRGGLGEFLALSGRQFWWITSMLQSQLNCSRAEGTYSRSTEVLHDMIESNIKPVHTAHMCHVFHKLHRFRVSPFKLYISSLTTTYTSNFRTVTVFQMLQCHSLYMQQRNLFTMGGTVIRLL